MTLNALSPLPRINHTPINIHFGAAITAASTPDIPEHAAKNLALLQYALRGKPVPKHLPIDTLNGLHLADELNGLLLRPTTQYAVWDKSLPHAGPTPLQDAPDASADRVLGALWLRAFKQKDSSLERAILGFIDRQGEQGDMVCQAVVGMTIHPVQTPPTEAYFKRVEAMATRWPGVMGNALSSQPGNRPMHPRLTKVWDRLWQQSDTTIQLPMALGIMTNAYPPREKLLTVLGSTAAGVEEQVAYYAGHNIALEKQLLPCDWGELIVKRYTRKQTSNPVKLKLIDGLLDRHKTEPLSMQSLRLLDAFTGTDQPLALRRELRNKLQLTSPRTPGIVALHEKLRGI